jgi:predicted nucleotidyltransferase
MKEIKDIIKEVKKNKKVLAVYQFGSSITGKANSLSDIDICIIGNLSENDKSRIFSHCTEKIDLSFFSELPIWIKARIFSEGKPLFISNEKKIKEIKFITLMNYLDFKHILDLMMRKVLEVKNVR